MNGPQCSGGHITAAAAAMLYSAKSRQNRSLGGLDLLKDKIWKYLFGFLGVSLACTRAFALGDVNPKEGQDERFKFQPMLDTVDLLCYWIPIWQCFFIAFLWKDCKNIFKDC